MVRGPRNREKLKGYYEQYMATGVLDSNVNPEIAASWAKSRAYDPPTDRIHTENRLADEELALRRQKHATAIAYLQGLTDNLREFCKEYDISVLLLDEECVILKSYSMPFFQMTPGEIEGVRVGLKEIGTSSVSMAFALQTPFWVFGPEMWVQESHDSDACSSPVMLDGKLRYIVTVVGMDYRHMPQQEAVMAVLKTMVYGLENFLGLENRLTGGRGLPDAVALASGEGLKFPAGNTGRLKSSWKADKETFTRLWEMCGGNVTQLAEMLHVSRVTLYRYLKKYGL